MHLLPGDPAIAILGEYATAEALEAIREKLDLNRPLLVQYTFLLWKLVQGDMGTSLLVTFNGMRVKGETSGKDDECGI